YLEAQPQVGVDHLRRPLAAGRFDSEETNALPIEQDLEFVRSPETLHLLIPIACEPDAQFIDAVLGKDVPYERATTRADGQPVEVILLRHVRTNPIRLSRRLGRATTDRQT